MKDEAEPKRWSAADGGAPAGLRELLAQGRAEVGSPSEVAELRQRVTQALSTPQASDAPRPVPVQAAGRSWLAWLAGGVTAAGAIWFFASGGDAAREAAPAPGPTPQAAPEVPLEPFVPPPAPTAPDPEQRAAAGGEESPPSANTQPRRAPERARGKSPPDGANTTAEAELLRRAQAALDEQPARALKLTDEHARRFRSGVLAEEREAIAVEALGRLGRDSAARQRAARFERRYPNSVHLDRVRSAVR